MELRKVAMRDYFRDDSLEGRSLKGVLSDMCGGSEAMSLRW